MGQRALDAPRIEDYLNVISRITGAILRAFLVMVLVATPSMLLPDVGTDTKQMVALIGVFLAALVLVEYSASYPSLIEFREAPPFNRLRYLMLFLTVFLLSIIARHDAEAGNLSALVAVVGGLIGEAIDFPYSPVRLVTLALANGADPEQLAFLRTAAGLSYLISLVTLAVFVVALRMRHWPARNRTFNVWVNLPTFDPTAGGDVVARLERDARVNIALGFLLPFLVPAVVKIGAAGFAPVTVSSPQLMIWVMAAWAFLPASLFMRGIAMAQIADMVRERRRRSMSEEPVGLVTA